MLFLVVSIGCSSDDSDGVDPVNPELTEQGNAVSEDDFETYEGALGMIYSARNIAKKGYVPATATLSVRGSEVDYEEVIELDQTSFMGRIEFPLEGMSDAVRSELENGLPVDIDVKDESGQSIYTNSISAVSFASNPAPSEVNVFELEETAANRKLIFDNDQDYLIQLTDELGDVRPKALRSDGLLLEQDEINAGDIGSDHDFRVVELSPNSGVFLIQHVSSGNYLSSVNNVFTQFWAVLEDVTSSQARTNNRYHFRFVKETEGAYKIRSVRNSRLLRSVENLFTFSSDFPTATPVYVRFISNSINWTVASNTTAFVAPILPKAQTSFGANSVLTNCTSAGGLSQTVGTNLTEVRTDKVGWSESLSITTTNTVGVSATVTAGFDASFFGTGGSYEASVSTNYQYERSVTENSSRFGESEKSTSENVFFERTVTVPPQSAALVYDVAQFYADTKIQIAQKLRLTATYRSGESVSGDVMATQLRFSRFDGVILFVGEDYLDVSLQGTMTLEKVLETQSKVQEVDPDCD